MYCRPITTQYRPTIHQDYKKKDTQGDQFKENLKLSRKQTSLIHSIPVGENPQLSCRNLFGFLQEAANSFPWIPGQSVVISQSSLLNMAYMYISEI